MGPGSQFVTLTLPPNAPTGSLSITVQASAGSSQHSASIALQVQQAQLANFSISLNNTELSFTQGASANTIVGVSITGTGNSNFAVLFSVTGLPSGVEASIATNPLAPAQPATLLTLTASPTSGLANYTTVTVTGTRNVDGMQESAQLTLNVTPPVGTLPAIRTDFLRTDGTPAAAVYDSVHNVIYSSNPQWNRVDIISATTHQIVGSVPAPSPTGMDMSPDGSQLIVGSNVQQIVSIDTASLQVVKRASVPKQTGNISSIPALIANTSNGTSLVGMTLNSSPPAYYLEQWNPANDSFTLLSPPGFAEGEISLLTRTGEGDKVLAVDYAGGGVAVYDAASNSFTASVPSPVGGVFYATGSPTTEQFALLGSGGLAIVDSNLNTLATPPVGGALFGMVYSPDGTKLFVATQIWYAQCGPNYPVLLTFDISTYSLVGVAPALSEPNGNPACNPPYYFQGQPLAADNAGFVYSNSGVFTPLSEGLVIDDPSNLQNVLSLPVGPPYATDIGGPTEAPLGTPLATTLGQTAFDVTPDVWFGNTRGTNIQLSGPGVSVTAPASATAGMVNVKAVLPDGWFLFAPQSFSYGSQILFLGANAGSPQGGASLALVGFGLIGNSNSPTVTIGGQAAKVTASSKYQDIIDSGVNATYPFQDVDEVVVTVPPGSPGAVDLTVTSGAGTSTLAKAFTYLPSVTDYSTPDTLSYVLYDTQRHWAYVSAGDHIDVFSADTARFISPIPVPSISGARSIRGLALTPDSSKLLAANFADISVAIIDPDDPSSGVAVPIPVTVGNGPGVADVVATSTGKAFVDGVSTTFSGCSGQVWELDLTTLKATLRTDLPFPGVQVGGNNFSRDTAGDLVSLAGTCGNYLWNAATDKFVLGLAGNSNATSGDGYWFASDYYRLDSQMIQRSQAQVPEFFSALLAFPDLPGEKMNASGSLLYTPVGQDGDESNAITITDTNLGTWVGQIILAEQILPLAHSAMDLDEIGNRLFVVTNKGLTLVQLSATPVSIGYLNPANGASSGGTAVTIRGSGFESGVTVSFGGAAATTTFVNGQTLQVVTPSGTSGGVRVSVENPDGTSYSLDAAFNYQ
jgi:hypothetical protein